MGEIRLNTPVVKNGNELYHSFQTDEETDDYFFETTFRVSYPLDISEVNEGILSIPLLTNICQAAWFTGHTLYVDVLDENMASSLGAIKDGYRETFENAGYDIDEFGEVAVKNRSNSGKDVINGDPGLLFTGGVDSIAGFFQTQDENPSLISIDFESKTSERREARNADRNNNTRNFADYYGVDDIYILASNSRSFRDGSELKRDSGIEEMSRSWTGGVQYPIGYMGIVAPLTEVCNIPRLYQSSGFAGKALTYEPTTNPLLIDPLQWARTDCELIGFGTTRQEKIDTIVSRHNTDWPFRIITCTTGPVDRPCLECEQCFRNVLGLYTAGGNPEAFGYELNGSFHEKVGAIFQGAEVRLSPTKAETWKNIQASLDQEKWAGPDSLYDSFKKSEIKHSESDESIDELSRSLKMRMYRSLPYPIDEISKSVYQVLR